MAQMGLIEQGGLVQGPLAIKATGCPVIDPLNRKLNFITFCPLIHEWSQLQAIYIENHCEVKPYPV